MRRMRAFTLVEFVVVLVLVGIVAVVAVPRWITSPNLDAVAQRLLADLRYTQSLAITHDQRFCVNFSLPNAYTITSSAGASVSNPSTGASGVTLTQGVTLSAVSNLPNNLIAFDERGIPYTDAAASVALASTASITVSRNGITRVITITPQTGSMRFN